MLIGTFTRLFRSCRVQFTSCCESRSPLGIMIFAPFSIANLTGSYTDFLYGAGFTSNFDGVSNLDGPFKCNDDSGNQVIYQVLQTKTDTYTQCTDQYGNFIDRNTRRSYRDEKSGGPDANAYNQCNGTQLGFFPGTGIMPFIKKEIYKLGKNGRYPDDEDEQYSTRK